MTTDSSTDSTSDASTRSTPIKLGFVINDIATEKNNFTTIRLARTAVNRGHEVALIGLGNFIYDANGTIRAHANIPRQKHYKDDDELLADLQGEGAETRRISVEDLDVPLLPNTPADSVWPRAFIS